MRLYILDDKYRAVWYNNYIVKLKLGCCNEFKQR